MRYWLMKPDPRLRSRVYCYYLAHPAPLSEWDPAAAYKDEELLIPDGHSEIVFNLGGAFERRVAHGAARASVMNESYVIGGRSQSVLTRDLGRVTVAGVKLDPRLLHALIRAPLGDFGEDTVSLSALGDRSLIDLEHAVAQEGDSAIRLAAVLDQFFLRALAHGPPSSARVDALVRDIHAHRGRLSILDWIRGHRFDHRNVERRFSAAMGMTPKRYARVIRFKHHYHMLVNGRSSADFLDGFHDRSHFNREFRSFMGAPPTARINASLPAGTSISDALLDSELAVA
jgi:AraC-like DNA-binding protein